MPSQRRLCGDGDVSVLTGRDRPERDSLTKKELHLSAGSPWPLGATWQDGGVNFAVYSEHAEKLILAVFEGENPKIELNASLPARTGFVWHGFLEGAGPGLRYGFRANGLFDPARGLRFNPSKLLLDPYAKAIQGQLDWDESLFDFHRVHGDHTTRNHFDSSDSVPRSVVIDPSFDWMSDKHPGYALADTVIYECHLKGLTKLHPEVPRALQGTYAGASHPAVLEHLKALGVTAVEFLPVHHFIDDEFLVKKGLVNYWGYNTIGFFAPMGRYAAAGDDGGQVREFKDMVRGYHAAGIEVILDVVYNHTAEGGREGPTLSFRGLDNSTYYRRPEARPDDYESFSGTGNTFNTQHPAVVRLVMDSLRYWVEEMHVDGFRFDLATSLGRDAAGFDSWSRLLSAINQDPVLQRTKLIAEPWDLGPEGYQVGRFPAGWAEWNDRFRDTARSFWLGHRATLGEFALRLAGSADMFDLPGRGPLASVNFVTCHDGFDLTDLVSYSRKHNAANGEGNQDGTDNNLSFNFGVEGPSHDPVVLDSRFRARRNLLTTTMLSHGIPMLLGGDELCQTQQGNNNAYCQDNPISWLDWQLDSHERDFLAFTQRLVQLRKGFASLRPIRYVESESPTPHVPGVVSWRDADGKEMTPSPWGRQDPRVLSLVIEPAPGMPPDQSTVLLILFNASNDPAHFWVPPHRHRRMTKWIVELDTSVADGASTATLASGKHVEVPACSILVASKG